MKILICDDEWLWLEQLNAYIEEYMKLDFIVVKPNFHDPFKYYDIILLLRGDFHELYR